MSIKAVFLDQHGTLVDAVPYNAEPRRMSLCSGAGPAMRLMAQLDYRLFVVSKQDGIAAGMLVPPALEQRQHRLNDLLFREQVQLDGFYYGPHDRCRMSSPGLLLQAASEHAIDLAASWMIGDILHHVEAGNRAGCRTLLVDTGNETEWRLGPHRVPTRIVPDLYAAAAVIAAADGVRL